MAPLYLFTISYAITVLIIGTKIYLPVLLITLALYIISIVILTIRGLRIPAVCFLIGGILFALFATGIQSQKVIPPSDIDDKSIVFDGFVKGSPLYNRNSTVYQVYVNRFYIDDRLVVHPFNMKYRAETGFAEPIRGDLIRGRCKIFIDENREPICISSSQNPPFIIERKQFNLLNSIDEYKRHLCKFIYSNYTGRVSDILIALSTGNSDDIPYETRSIFSRSGTAHILAISGTHIGLISVIFYYILKLLLLPFSIIRPFSLKKGASILLIPLMIVVSLYFGNTPSVVRATIMVIVYLLSIIIERERDVLSSLCVAFLLITSYSVDSIRDIGFQLSFLSVLGIITLVPSILKKESLELEANWMGAGRAIMILFFTSISASLFTAPIVAHNFGIVSIIGFVANILIVPFVGSISLPLIMLGVVFYGVSTGLSEFFFNAAFLSLGHFYSTNEFFSNLPLSYIKFFKPHIVEILLYYSILALIVLRRRLPFAKAIIISMILVMIITSLVVDRIYINRLEPVLMVRKGVVALIDEDKRAHLVLDKYATQLDKIRSVEFLRERRIIRVAYTNAGNSNDLYIKDHLYVRDEGEAVKASESGDYLLKFMNWYVFVYSDIEQCPPKAARFIISRRSSEEAISRLFDCGISAEKLIFSGDIKNKNLPNTLQKYYQDASSKIQICKDNDCEIKIEPVYETK
jgi:competence protein ComEC